MSKGRLEAFSDAVIAIIMTIMVLELRTPQGTEWQTVRPVLPALLTYVLSFVFLGIYWTNHHHMLQATERINGAVLWANLHLLFWLSLIPFAMEWMAENDFTSLPTAVYGCVLLLAGLSWAILLHTILAAQDPGSMLAAAVGRDRKGKLSTVIYLVAIPMAFVKPWIAGALYATVALIWLVPDRRIERRIEEERRRGHHPSDRRVTVPDSVSDPIDT